MLGAIATPASAAMGTLEESLRLGRRSCDMESCGSVSILLAQFSGARFRCSRSRAPRAGAVPSILSSSLQAVMAAPVVRAYRVAVQAAQGVSLMAAR